MITSVSSPSADEAQRINHFFNAFRPCSVILTLAIKFGRVILDINSLVMISICPDLFRAIKRSPNSFLSALTLSLTSMALTKDVG
jgi:hypothetical protein